MSSKQASVRYGQTLLTQALGSGIEDKIKSDVKVLLGALTHRDLNEAVKSPIISAEKKKSILDQIFKGKVDALSISFLNLMIDKGRHASISDALNAFDSLYNEKKNIKSVKITTATELSEVEFNALVEKLKAKYFKNATLDIQKEINADLIGGFVLEFEDKLLDASIKHGLTSLANQYSN